MKTDLIASVCHDANRAVCQSAGDFSQLPWALAEAWQAESAIKGVQFVLDNPDSTAEDLHNAWCRDKVADGWVYGEEKNVDRKTHPCLVAYQKLPKVQQDKDKVFRTIVTLLKDI